MFAIMSLMEASGLVHPAAAQQPASAWYGEETESCLVNE